MPIDLFQQRGINVDMPRDLFAEIGLDPTKQQPQMAEENQPNAYADEQQFANPTQAPGFQDLNAKEKLQRIALSQFDPSNLTSTGTMVPPGTYQAAPTRMAASVAPTMLAPELSVGSNLLARYGINPLINLASRIGQGTASDIAYNLPDINNLNSLKQEALKGGLGSAAVEGLTAPFRIPAYFAEMFNPLKYGVEKSKQIQNELSATKSMTDQLYKPVNDAYDAYTITANPKNYLSNLNIKRKDLFPDAKLIYDDFMDNPTFGNLHKLQSKLGTDWARVSQSPAYLEKAQLFAQQRDNALNAMKKVLGQDKNALNSFNLATDYAKNNYFPYLATPTLRKIAKGKLDVSPNALSKSIKKATEKTVGSGAAERSVIPEGHPLRNHMADLEKMMNFGQAAKFAVPALTGAAAGEYLHPGLGGIAGGAASGLGAAQLSNMASKFGAPSFTQFMQNPLVQGLFEKTAPLYYLGARGAVNALNPNQ